MDFFKRHFFVALSAVLGLIIDRLSWEPGAICNSCSGW